MSDIRVHLTIRGVVQGVGFRYFATRWAEKLGLNGWVRNNWDDSVETEVEGERSAVEEYISQMKIGPRSAHVTAVDVQYQPYEGNYKNFDSTR